MEKEMKKEMIIIKVVNYLLKENILMEKEMEKEENITFMVK